MGEDPVKNRRTRRPASPQGGYKMFDYETEEVTAISVMQNKTDFEDSAMFDKGDVSRILTFLGEFLEQIKI